ncbi:MAG: TlpA disulfide reductase family protein [Bdellovibrionales bacterium]
MVLFLGAWPQPVGASDFSQHFSVLSRPRPAPIFTFKDESGQSLTLKDFKGRFVLLNLWATWCASCVSEMPSLEALQRHFDPSRLTVVALSVDRNGLAAVQSFYRRHDISGLTPYLDPESLSINALDAHFLPTTLLIDAQGREVGRIKGSVDWSAPEVIKYIEERIGER